MLSISDALREVMKTHGVSRRDPRNEVFDAWNRAAGPLAKRAVPARFYGGELLILVESSAHYHELINFTGSLLQEKTNALLGTDKVQRVVFKLKR